MIVLDMYTHKIHYYKIIVLFLLMLQNLSTMFKSNMLGYQAVLVLKMKFLR